MALRGFYLNPGFGTLEHALGSQNKKPKANAVHTGRGESPSWVKYALTNTPINSIPTKCPLASCCRPEDVLMSKREALIAGLDNWAVGGHFKNAFEFSTGTYFFFIAYLQKFIGKFRI